MGDGWIGWKRDWMEEGLGLGVLGFRTGWNHVWVKCFKSYSSCLVLSHIYFPFFLHHSRFLCHPLSAILSLPTRLSPIILIPLLLQQAFERKKNPPDQKRGIPVYTTQGVHLLETQTPPPPGTPPNAFDFLVPISPFPNPQILSQKKKLD